ncbi:MAG TPA: hypothetical protein VKY19_08780 [Ktedonosporobacter sp.]|jgi:hypothetical protein|nr:hypothetical protein [Ktedonosporobacter sp.]
MQDKSFLQAIQELQTRIANNFQESISQMLLYRTTVANATADIKDEKVRMVVTSILITGQITALLTLMKDMGFLDKEQYNEFITYLLSSLTAQHDEFIMDLLHVLASLPPTDTIL